MMRTLQATLIGMTIALCLAAAGSQAEDAINRCGESCCEGHLRAGCPQVVARYARPTDSAKFFGYYVGGGAAVGGQSRCCDEGTWGWDYGGCLIPNIVALDWWHGRHGQGGNGAYRTAGPSLRPGQ